MAGNEYVFYDLEGNTSRTPGWAWVLRYDRNRPQDGLVPAPQAQESALTALDELIAEFDGNEPQLRQDVQEAYHREGLGDLVTEAIDQVVEVARGR